MTNSKNQINIFFAEDDIKQFSPEELLESYNLGNVRSNLVQTEYPQLALNDQADMIRATNEFFDELVKSSDINELQAYSNNFYECSLLPIARYLHSLNKCIDELTINGESVNNINVFFPSRLIFPHRYSSYFMAEHESQRSALYNRQQAFQPYLEKLCENRGVRVFYKSYSLGLSSYFSKPARILAVVIFRYINIFKHKFITLFNRAEKPNDFNKNQNCGRVIVSTRSKSQSEAIEGFIKSIGEPSDWIFGYSSVDIASNLDLGVAIAKETPLISVHALKPSAFKIATNDLKILMKLPFSKKYVIKLIGVDLVLNQAISEIMFMLSELLAYRHQLSNKLESFDNLRGVTLLSTEQKSPHIFVEAELAKSYGMRCVQIMQCDQEYIDLPCPVRGDAFIADTLESFKKFKLAWSRHSHKLHYFGKIKSIRDRHRVSDSRKDILSDQFVLCVFLQCDDLETNLKVLNELSGIEKGPNIIIKTHPRDKIKYYQDYLKNFEFIDPGIRKNVLFNRFDIAMTFPSAVTLDLEIECKPFLLLNFGRWAATNVRDSSAKSSRIITEPSEITSEISNLKDFMNLHNSNESSDSYINLESKKVLWDILNASGGGRKPC
jgi:hypothetical protein